MKKKGKKDRERFGREGFCRRSLMAGGGRAVGGLAVVVDFSGLSSCPQAGGGMEWPRRFGFGSRTRR
jgi:hypothetical protein